MPVERREVSISQFCELLGIEPKRLIAVERKSSTMVLILEPDDAVDSGASAPAQRVGGGASVSRH